MSPELHQLYARLADGERHNGAELARQMGITRAAVWKRIQSLRQLGLPVAGTAGEGYRLDRPVELLDADTIRAGVADTEIQVKVLGSVDSTNARLAADGAAHGHVVLAETQTAGRGRRGRGWLSPPGAGIYLSLAWRFEAGLSGLAPLSLVVGIAAADVLADECGAPVKVKWPNDLHIGTAKVGGCLVEISGAAEGPCRAVIGVGVNLYLPKTCAIDQEWTSLAQHGELSGRNRMASALINALGEQLRQFEREGFEPFTRRWQAHDALYGRPVRVIHPRHEVLTGIAAGIDSHGRLRVRAGEQVHVISAGEVSVRVA